MEDGISFLPNHIKIEKMIEETTTYLIASVRHQVLNYAFQTETLGFSKKSYNQKHK